MEEDSSASSSSSTAFVKLSSARSKPVAKRKLDVLSGREEQQKQRLELDTPQQIQQDAYLMLLIMYDLFPHPGTGAGDSNNLTVLYETPRAQNEPLGSLWQSQRCHWYEGRGKVGAEKTQRTRCHFRADVYPFFCAFGKCRRNPLL